jgi:hypothetical protein
MRYPGESLEDAILRELLNQLRDAGLIDELSGVLARYDDSAWTTSDKHFVISDLRKVVRDHGL